MARASWLTHSGTPERDQGPTHGVKRDKEPRLWAARPTIRSMNTVGENVESKVSAQARDALATVEEGSSEVTTIPVHISYEIIRLFSEGLYQSPQKAIEELVSNSYDAGASAAHVLLPDTPDGSRAPTDEDSDAGGELPPQGTNANPTPASSTVETPPHDHDIELDMPPLWVVDDGSGLDAEGFAQLWRVADSRKGEVTEGERLPIGQFGIGKLAAYVLAWRLTHISKVDGVIRLTSMDFKRLEGRHQYDSVTPLDLSLREIDEERAMAIMADIEGRDPVAWNLMFGATSSPTWTAAALSDFKNLYEKLAKGRLDWVLRTGLPLHSKFAIWLDGKPLESSKESRPTILTYKIGGADDSVAEALGILNADKTVSIPGIDGTLTGEARLFKQRLTENKSDQYGRSHGFFVRVRDRVVNLEDELFGLDALNHATWSRFSMEIMADGLRSHLLSSREGIRESDPIAVLKEYMHGVFNVCRNAYDKQSESEQAGIDISKLLTHAPSAYVSEPLIESVRAALELGQESYYISAPDVDDDVDKRAWIANFSTEIAGSLFSEIIYEGTGPYDRAIRYYPETRKLLINTDHPYIEKLLSAGRNRAAATLFGSSELLVDALLQDYGVPRSVVINLLSDRDRVLRLVAGDEPSTAAEVVRLLKSAMTHETALERAVGMAFRVLGFEYERRGGNAGGADGVLYARLGRGTSENLADYKIVYDAKQTSKPSVPADKISLTSLEAFRNDEGAQFGFFLAVKYEGQENPQSKLNRMIASAAELPITLLRIEDLQRLVEIHHRYGVTLTRLKSLFSDTHSVQDVTLWLDELEEELSTLEPQVPLMLLLETLEEAKNDEKEVPSVTAVRLMNTQLKGFLPERLLASLSAVQTIVGRRWIEVDSGTKEVRLHANAGQIVAEVERNLRDMYGVDAMERPNVAGS